MSDLCLDCKAEFSSFMGLVVCPSCGSRNINWIGEPRLGKELEVPRVVQNLEKRNDMVYVGQLLINRDYNSLNSLGYSQEDISKLLKVLEGP